jgi:hypothetical protein
MATIDESDSWNNCKVLAPDAIELGKKTIRLAENLAEMASAGNADGLRNCASRLRTEVNNLLDVTQRIENSIPQTKTAEEFAIEIESLARMVSELNQVARTGHRVLLGAVVVRTATTSQGEMTATIGHASLRTSSSATVINEAVRQSKDKLDHKKLIKAFREAFNYHVALRGGDPLTALVTLDDIRRVINITRDGSAYSIEEMTHDIQRLIASADFAMKDAGISFVAVPAAKVQFEFVSETGSITNLGGIQIAPPAKAAQ